MNLPRKEKQQAQESEKIKYSQKTQKDLRRLQKTTKDFISLKTL